jgi:uncharacterized protein with HEPN domain
MDIAAYVERFGDDCQSFYNDSAYFNAVSMCLLQIGELANGLSQDFRVSTTHRIQWNLVRGMRNWIAHAYQEVDKETIWGTVKEDIPSLLQFCQEIITEESPSNGF